MSKRERWIVYPLLLFAVASAVATNLRSQAVAVFGVVECNRIVVKSPQGVPRVVIGSSIESQGGQILVHGPSAGASNGVIMNVNDVQAEIGAGNSGGFVKIAGTEGVPFLTLGHDDAKQISGLVATDQLGRFYEESTNADSFWGPTLSWDAIPNAHREFEKAKSKLRESAGDNTPEENEEEADKVNAEEASSESDNTD